MKTKNNLLRGGLVLAFLISTTFLLSFTDRGNPTSGPKKSGETKSVNNVKSKVSKTKKPDLYCVATRVISGVTYTFEGDYPTSNVVMRVNWGTNTTGVGNFGTFYVNGSNVFCVNIPTTPVHYDGPVANCGD